jgi:hypothetical protein
MQYEDNIQCTSGWVKEIMVYLMVPPYEEIQQAQAQVSNQVYY